MNNNIYTKDSDYRVEFHYMPIYREAAGLMAVLMTDRAALTSGERTRLKELLRESTGRNLRGHGYEALRGQIDALNIFMEAGLREFIIQFPNLCPIFTKMILGIADAFAWKVKEKNFRGPWGEDYEEEIREINSYFKTLKVFVYGTLQQGQCNHHYLENDEFLGAGTISDFDKYDLGWFPGIVDGNGIVDGEIYLTGKSNLAALDRLEGEGSLYNRRCVKVSDEKGGTDFALVYVYNGDPKEEGRKLLNDCVWYVAYGSNMLERRLGYYIRGGYCPENGRHYTGCADKTMPKKSVPVELPFDMYYGNYGMGAWENSAVSFIDPMRPGRCLGRAYLVTREQLSEIHDAEGRSEGWYPEAIRLKDIEGVPAYTFGGYDSKIREPFDRVSDAYKSMLIGGMRETYPEMTEEEIKNWLE